MANSTTTTKSTSKTTKKATASKVAAKKSTKTVVTEPVKTVSVRSAKRTQQVLDAATFKRWHLLSAVFFAVLAVVAAVLTKDSYVQVSLGHLTQNLLESTESKTVFAPAQHVLYDISVKWILVALLSASSLLSLARATRLSGAEASALANRISPWRWVDVAVTGAIGVELVALLFGAQDIVTIKALGWIVALGAIFAWLAERERAGATHFVKASYGAVVASFVVAGLGLLSFIGATYVFSDIRAPWYAYGIAAVGAASVVAILANLRMSLRGARYEIVERNYIIKNLVAKVAIAVIGIVGLLA